MPTINIQIKSIEIIYISRIMDKVRINFMHFRHLFSYKMLSFFFKI